MACILVVDDEEDMREAIAYNLERAGHTVLRSAGAADALEQLEKRTPDVIISDVMMPGMDGLAFCEEVRARVATALTPFLFVTAKGQASDKYAGLRAGADDYVTKPFELSDLLARVDGRIAQHARAAALQEQLTNSRKRWAESSEPRQLLEIRCEQTRIVEEARRAGYSEYEVPLPDPPALAEMVRRLEKRFPPLADIRRRMLIGEAPCLLAVFEDVVLAAQTGDPVLVIGETGSGKTAVAEAIARLGPRAERAFRTVNCAELAAGDPTIAIGKLFGYGRGSGLPNLPREGQRGLLEESDGGVLFLDEVGDLPRQAQTLLLLPLEGRPFSPAVGIGSSKTVDVKFICATNRDLRKEVEEGRFPRDLYERLAAHVIRLPALREHPEDIPALVRHLLSDAAAEQGAAEEISDDTLAVLSGYHWPGNVRELRRVLRQAAQRAAIRGRARITREDLHPELLGGRGPPRLSEPVPSGQLAPPAGPAEDDLRAAGFSDRELAEIAALRAADLRVGEAEALLGYSHKSRTFSHRLRGIFFKALSLTAWDPERAARLVVGEDPGRVLITARRLRSLLDGVAQRVEEPEEKLLANLLQEHRRYALEARDMVRRRQRN